MLVHFGLPESSTEFRYGTGLGVNIMGELLGAQPVPNKTLKFDCDRAAKSDSRR